MKFYNDKISSYSWRIIIFNKLTAIHCDYYGITFYKNGKHHNTKNASYISKYGSKQFCLNNMSYGCKNDFTKESWRRFVKLQVFL